MLSQLRWNSHQLRFFVGLVIVAVLMPTIVFGQLQPTPAGTPTPAATPAATPAQPGEERTLQQEIDAADLAKLRELAGGMEQLMAAGKYEEALAFAGLLAQRVRAIMSDATITLTPAQASTARDMLTYFVTAQARALGGLQEDKAALQLFSTILEENETFAPALTALGDFYLDRNDVANAQANYEAALQSERGNIPASFGMGKTLALIAGAPGSDPRYNVLAIKPLTRVIDHAQNPFVPEALRHRGAAYGGLSQFDKALADINKSLEADPNNHETYLALGVVHTRREDFAAAAEAFGKSTETYKPKPGREAEPYTDASRYKAMSLIEVGRRATDDATRKANYQAALEESQRTLAMLDEKSPLTAGARADLLVMRGICERMCGLMGAAIRTFSQAIEINPSLGEAYFRRGICLQQIGEDRMAVNDFTQAAIVNYTDPRGNLWEGFMYAKLGNYHEAIRAYGDAIAASDRYTPAYVNRGLAYMQLGEMEKAIADFNDALRIEPTNGDYYFKRGVAQMRLNQLDKAKESLASAIEFDPTHRDAYRYLADVLQKQGHADLAEQYRKKADELNKKPSAP